MGLKGIFQKAANIAFTVAGDVKITAVFTNIIDNGIDDPVSVYRTVNAIRLEFNADDYRSLTFKELIQPMDSKLLVKCSEISEFDSNDKIIIDGFEYSIIGYEKDAADAVWTIGIRG
jgi:hypothetical protein